MHIVHITSELAPAAKVGGLADVVHGLSRELERSGHHVDIILPKYDCLRYEDVKDLHVFFRDLESFEGPYRFPNTIWSGTVDGLRIYFIEPHHPNAYFSRGKIYGEKDDVERFTYFARTALEFLFKTGQNPDILHLHDWPTAIAAPLYKDMYRPLGLNKPAVVFTIHNLAHQGKCHPHILHRVGLNPDLYYTPEKLQDPHHTRDINLLKGAIVYSDAVTTVSPTYEKEIQTTEGGHGLHEVLRAYALKLHGILNGIDSDYWNPETDPHLIARYATHPPINEVKLKSITEAKKRNKRQLQVHLGLQQNDLPLCGTVTRLVAQKGPELIYYAIERTLELGGQFALLGGNASPEIAKQFVQLQKEYQYTGNAAIRLDYDEALAHQIYASADLFIIPSVFEPCGLTQMIALRYGAVPIVRSTGGLADTVFDKDDPHTNAKKSNGFAFIDPDHKGVNWALSRAVECWKDHPDQWLNLMCNGISMDFSWQSSAQQYLQLYRQCCLSEGV